MSSISGAPPVRAALTSGSALRRAAAAGYDRARRLVVTHALITDLVFALLVGVVSVPWLVTVEPGVKSLALHVASWLLIAGLLIPLVWRRRYPVAVFVAVCAVALVQWFLRLELVADLSLLVALSTLATYRPRQASLVAAAILEAGVVMAAFRWDLAGSWQSALVFLSGLNAAALLLGISLRARRLLIASLTERADRLERERDQQALLAASAERTRIAREMHDVIGHRLAVIVNLAEGAGAKLTIDPPRAASAIASVAEVGRQALGEARGLLDVLRTDGTSDGLEPQPGVARLADLVAQTRATGLTATLDCQGDLAALPADVELAVYRIAQEAITNTLRHAVAPSTVLVRVRATAARVDLLVTDDGQAGAPAGRSGHGLAGMRERARACGGSVTVGPGAGPGSSGWAVEARLPVGAR
jgi:signal transduction histidine kinase